MGASIPIRCPVEGCPYSTFLHFDPGVEDSDPALAAEELKAEHPGHAGKSWKFRARRYESES